MSRVSHCDRLHIAIQVVVVILCQKSRPYSTSKAIVRVMNNARQLVSGEGENMFRNSRASILQLWYYKINNIFMNMNGEFRQSVISIMKCLLQFHIQLLQACHEALE